ncbi:MAG TPA: hypothetical protein VLB44_11310 [Kofleriaceae bacterium]|nr:hypothetical protein [Kofleriaceae bacterium]
MPITAGTGGASYGGAAYGGASYGSATDGAAYGGTPYGGALPQGGQLTWTVRVTDNATGAPLSQISVTAVEQTWDCKTRELPDPQPDLDHRHGPARIETYDCKGGTHHITKMTDASGAVTFKLPHSQYQLAPIKHQAYFPTDFPDPMYQRIASSLVKTSITNGGASRLTEYRLFPYSALKVKTEAQAEALALQNPIVKKCLAQHPQLTHAIEKPSLMWRVQFLHAGAKNLELLTTVDSISADVGFLGCWDPCCAARAPSRFERRLTECAKLRSATLDERKRWDCDTLTQDFARLQDFYRRQGDTASLQKYEELYRAYEQGEK